MEFTPPGRLRDATAFAARWAEVAPELGCVVDAAAAAAVLARPFVHRGRSIGNRFAAQPMEGWDGEADGTPSARTLRRWRRFGESGAKLIWGGEAFAVREDGRANPRQLFCNPAVDVRSGLASLRQALLDGHRQHGGSLDDLHVGLQLTHSGRYAQPHGARAPKLAARHPVLDARVGATTAPLLTDGELEAIGDSFVRAAQAAADVGFDFVDVKCCHGYLLHELLWARHRPGRYGGVTLADRTRLLLRIIAAIRSQAPALEVGVRVSLGDIVPYAPDARGVGVPVPMERPYDLGFGVDADDPTHSDFGEPARLLALLYEHGVRLLNVTLGSPYSCPHLQRPAAYPPSDGYLPPADPLFAVAEHLRAVRACRRAHADLVVVGSGYSYLQEFVALVGAHEVDGGHADFVGLGRMLLSYPELPRDVLAGRALDRKRICRTFSDCTTAPRNGLPSGCYPLDPFYKQAPEAALLRAAKQRGTGR